MSSKVQLLFEALPDRGSIEDLGLLIDKIRDLYDLEHVVYHAVSLGQNCMLASKSKNGALANNVGFWHREAASLVAVTYAPQWGERYIEAEYLKIDPVVEGAAVNFLPMDWKMLAWNTKKRQQFLREAVEFGLGNQGYTVPIRGPQGQFALFTINKTATDDEWSRFIKEFASDFLVIAHFFHGKVIEIERIATERAPVTLSNREKDILKLLAEGQSRAQVAYKLNISENTLRVYVDSARHKLGALNIIHAVAIGVNRGILN